MVRFLMHPISVAPAILAATASSALGGFSYTSQSRSISATAVSGGVTDQRSSTAPGFGLFDESVSAQAFNPDTGFSGFGSARQYSELNDLSVVFFGSWSGHRDGQAGFPGGGGTSTLSIAFRLDVPSAYTLTVTQMGAGMFGIAWIDGPMGVFLIQQPGTYSGTMPAGRYILDASCTGSGGFPPGSGGTSVDLRIPAPPGAGVLVAAGAVIRRRRPLPASRDASTCSAKRGGPERRLPS